MTHLHLSTGCALVPDGNALLLVSPDEQFAALSGTPDELREIHLVLTGEGPVPADGAAHDVAVAVVDWGVGDLHDVPPTSAPPVSLADLTAAADLVAAARAHHPGLEPEVTDLLDDAALRAGDRTAPGCRLPVHRELGYLVVGPALGPVDPARTPLSWDDVRVRRLAASPAPDQLALLWRTWSLGRPVHDVRPGADQLSTALRTATTYVHDHPDLLPRHQLLVPLTGDAPPSTHPVLPVPVAPSRVLDRAPVPA